MNTVRRFVQLPTRDKASVARELLIGAVCAAVSMAVFGYFALNAWPGAAHHCAVVWDVSGATAVPIDPHLCFCESFELSEVLAGAPGVRQVSNTWSNLVPLFTGLLLALRSGVDRLNQGLIRPSREATWAGQYPLIFVLIVGFMGPGSMFYHASITEWGGYVDNLSMLLFVWFLLVYGVFVRRSKLDHEGRYGWFWALFGFGVAAEMAILLGTELYVSGKAGYLLWPAVAFGLAEVYAMFRGATRTWWFWCAVVSVAAALGVWATSRQFGEALCLGGPGMLGPDSFVQAHAIWHVLANLTAVFLFLHFRGTDTPADH